MSVSYISENFLLENKTSRTLYYDYADGLPIIDYHSHLSPRDIASDRSFQDIADMWLGGDHYKWRAMRANGVDERFCSGPADPWEKFQKWAETVPYTLGNPLYHWTHMEMKNPFGVTELLDGASAQRIYRTINERLRERFSVRRLLQHFNVEAVCTTDEPLDSLEHHRSLAEEGFSVKVLPSFRPDAALLIERPDVYLTFLRDLAAAAGIPIVDFPGLIACLKNRHDHFAAHGCVLADHGGERVYAVDYTPGRIESIFTRMLSSEELTPLETAQFKSAVQYELALMHHEKNWTQMFHIGALRNVNAIKFRELGPNSGYDTIGDAALASDLARFLDRLEREDKLAKTIIFNLNPKDNAAFAAMIGNFQDSRIPGKVQWGPAWWFLDNRDGIQDHLKTLSAQGLLRRFVGMVTDSRSFLSFSRHEYFRRILCNFLGTDAERGLLPHDIDLLGRTVQEICYLNAKEYFRLEREDGPAL